MSEFMTAESIVVILVLVTTLVAIVARRRRLPYTVYREPGPDGPLARHRYPNRCPMGV